MRRVFRIPFSRPRITREVDDELAFHLDTRVEKLVADGWNRDDARDVVHDAFVRMWRKRDSIDWPRAGGLAFRTVLGLAANRRRANGVRALLAPLVPWAREDRAVDAPDTRLVDAEADAAARRAIDRLPERLRSVLVLCTFTVRRLVTISSLLFRMMLAMRSSPAANEIRRAMS